MDRKGVKHLNQQERPAVLTFALLYLLCSGGHTESDKSKRTDMANSHPSHHGFIGACAADGGQVGLGRGPGRPAGPGEGAEEGLPEMIP